MKSYSLSHLHRNFSLIWHKFTAFLLNHIANEASSQSIHQSINQLIKHSINQLVNLLISKMNILILLSKKRCALCRCVKVVTNRKEWELPGGRWKRTDLDRETARTCSIVSRWGKNNSNTYIYLFYLSASTVFWHGWSNNDLIVDLDFNAQKSKGRIH